MLRRLGVKESWSRAFDVVVVLFAIVGLVQILLWMDRSMPLTVHERVITTPVVSPGEDFRYTNYFTRHEYCDTHVSRWFVSSEGLRMDIEPLGSFMPTDSLGQPQFSAVSIPTPKMIPPGITKSCFQSTWMCNPIQRVWPLVGPETCLTFLVRGPPFVSDLSLGPAPRLSPRGFHLVDMDP